MSSYYQKGIRRRSYRPRGAYPPPKTRGMVVGIDLDGYDVPVAIVVFARGGLARCPVLQHGSSATNVARWMPQPARVNLVTGAAVKLAQDRLDPAPADIFDLDGDVVIVDWVEDVDRPVIVGTIEHPRRRRALVAEMTPGTDDARRDSALDERFLAHQGTTLRVDRLGAVRVDARRAGVDNGGSYIAGDAEAQAGVVEVVVRAGKRVSIRVDEGAGAATVFEVASDGTVRIGKPDDRAGRLLLAAPTLEHVTQWQAQIDAALTAIAALWPSIQTATAAAALLAPGAVVPVTVTPAQALSPAAPLLLAPLPWQAPVRASETPGLTSTTVEISERAE
ncbi:MAG: hypothetical protein EKK55_19265 [Rhodocyclaceae bacterium]|nr:MAG: hypothetical protein EKK55_19265 [Rhodocyclaceae bacterium]